MNHGGFQPPLASRKSTIHSFISRWTPPEEAGNKPRSQTDSNYHLHTCQTRPDKQINSLAHVYSHDKLRLFAECSLRTAIHHGMLGGPSLASGNKNAFFSISNMHFERVCFPGGLHFYISQSAVSLQNDTCRHTSNKLINSQRPKKRNISTSKIFSCHVKSIKEPVQFKFTLKIK